VRLPFWLTRSVLLLPPLLSMPSLPSMLLLLLAPLPLLLSPLSLLLPQRQLCHVLLAAASSLSIGGHA